MEVVTKISLVLCQCVELIHQLDNNDDTTDVTDEIIYECCRLLRNSCATGQSIQTQIANVKSEFSSIFHSINRILLKSSSKLSNKSRKMCWQFIANLGVQNEVTQQIIWNECIEHLITEYHCVCDSENSREMTMILYNIFSNSFIKRKDAKKITEFLLECHSTAAPKHDLENNDFHQIFMEHLIRNYRDVAAIYDKLTPPEKRLALLYYIVDHTKEPNHDTISTNLLKFLCSDFKKKSDCILRAADAQINFLHPKEVIALLDVIAQVSHDQRYAHVLAIDSSIFINVGCLLRTINDLNKKSLETGESTIFSPVQKLDQLSPNSTEDSSIERDITYQLRTTLVRVVTNLTYKNKKNQDLVGVCIVNPNETQIEMFCFVFSQAREMDIIMAVLDSTSLDARNPCS